MQHGQDLRKKKKPYILKLKDSHIQLNRQNLESKNTEVRDSLKQCRTQKHASCHTNARSPTNYEITNT